MNSCIQWINGWIHWYIELTGEFMGITVRLFCSICCQIYFALFSVLLLSALWKKEQNKFDNKLIIKDARWGYNMNLCAKKLTWGQLKVARWLFKLINVIIGLGHWEHPSASDAMLHRKLHKFSGMPTPGTGVRLSFWPTVWCMSHWYSSER